MYFFTEYTSDESIYERGFSIPLKKLKPKTVSDPTRKMILNLYDRIKKTWSIDKYYSTTAMLQRMSEITGISEYVIYPVLKDILEQKPVRKSILKKNSAEVTKLNSLEMSAITKLVHNFYLQGDLPTIYRIYYAVRDSNTLPNVSMKTLKSVLRRLRFKYLIDNNTVLLQSNGAALRRINYIQNILKLRKENRKIFFIDNTSIKAGKCQVSAFWYLLRTTFFE